MAGMPDASWAGVAPAEEQGKGGESIEQHEQTCIACARACLDHRINSAYAGLPAVSCGGVAPAEGEERAGKSV